MKPPRAHARGILHFFGGIRRSTRLAYSAEAAASAAKAGRQGYCGSNLRIHPRAYTRGLLRRRIKFLAINQLQFFRYRVLYVIIKPLES